MFLVGMITGLLINIAGHVLEGRGWTRFGFALQAVGGLLCLVGLGAAIWLAWQADGSLTACSRFCD